MIHRDSILYSDQDLLCHIHSQKHLSAEHARWVGYLQQFSFFLKHKMRAENRVADALSRMVALLDILYVSSMEIENIKSEYATNPKLGKIHATLATEPATTQSKFSPRDGYLFH